MAPSAGWNFRISRDSCMMARQAATKNSRIVISVSDIDTPLLESPHAPRTHQP